jgi:hypothetical protein
MKVVFWITKKCRILNMRPSPVEVVGSAVGSHVEVLRTLCRHILAEYRFHLSNYRRVALLKMRAAHCRGEAAATERTGGEERRVIYRG